MPILDEFINQALQRNNPQEILQILSNEIAGRLEGEEAFLSDEQATRLLQAHPALLDAYVLLEEYSSMRLRTALTWPNVAMVSVLVAVNTRQQRRGFSASP